MTGAVERAVGRLLPCPSESPPAGQPLYTGRGIRSQLASPPWVVSVVRSSSASLDAIDFFVYSRAAPSAAEVEHDPALDEEHWSYMDGFADGMIARGPTLAADRETWTGSIHIVELPSAAAAQEFAEREPYNRAGLFEGHFIRRFENLLGRTMWESPAVPDLPRFFVIAREAEVPARPIVHGALRTLEDRPAGVAFALQAPAREDVEALVTDGQVLDWEFGGRR
jgi:uncharacterized protein